MNKTLKWVLISLGILVGLLIIAAVVFHAFAIGTGHMGEITKLSQRPYGMMDQNNDFGRGIREYNRMPKMGFMPMMAFGLFRGIFGLGILALAVVGLVHLIRHGRAKHDATIASAQPLIPVEPEVSCQKCGKSLKSEWTNCPYCGKKK